MTVISPLVFLWLADALALAAGIAACWRLARRFKSLPPRVPLRLRFDGRPRAVGPKAGLFLAPGATLFVVVVLTIALLVHRPPEYQRPALALAFVILAEIAWFAAWSSERQIEIARGMTVRIAPQRMVAIAFPIAATIVIALAVIIGQTM
jgi:hypothetical protein